VGRVDDKTATGCAASECYALFPRIEGGAAGPIAAMGWIDRRTAAVVSTRGGRARSKRSIRSGPSR
jgi:hypothetical protein